MKTEVEIDEGKIQGLVIDMIVKRLANDLYTKYFQDFSKTKYNEINSKLNSEIKNTVSGLVNSKFENWKNTKNETMGEYIDRRMTEAVDGIDFEKLIKEKLIK